MMSTLRNAGLRSDHMYTAGFVSIGLTFAAWAVSKARSEDSKAQADRWGLFVGEWAPTFFAVGIALKLEEQGVLSSLTKR